VFGELRVRAFRGINQRPSTTDRSKLCTSNAWFCLASKSRNSDHSASGAVLASLTPLRREELQLPQQLSGCRCSTFQLEPRTVHRYRKQEDFVMLGWALTFLIIALIAGVLGFGGVAVVSVEIAKLIFVVFLILFLVSIVLALLRGRRSPMP
jgi:uncharacterized membrane protein YtjA (UPF0391 family)